MGLDLGSRSDTVEQLRNRSLQLELAVAGVSAIVRDGMTLDEKDMFALRCLSIEVSYLARKLDEGR